MVRQYKRKGARRWRDSGKRMELAIGLRAGGKSLREIGTELGVSRMTVKRDLDQWDREHPNVTPLRAPKSVTSARHILPPAGQFVTPECDGESAPRIRRIR